MIYKQKIVPYSDGLQAKWSGLKTAVCEAAKPFVGGDVFPMSCFYADMLPGASKEMDRALHGVKAETVHATTCIMDPSGKIGIHLTWRE